MPRRNPAILLSAIALLALRGAPAAAQQPTAPVRELCATLVRADSATSQRRPDLVISATVEANEVRFRSSPEVQVRLVGCEPLDSAAVTERENLPKPVQPGVTYRDVRVSVEIAGYLDVRCLLDALAAPADTAAAGRAAARACAPIGGAAPRQGPRRP